jgi:hypothetical protein
VAACSLSEVPHAVDRRFDRQDRARGERHGGKRNEIRAEHAQVKGKADAAIFPGF